MDIFRSKKEEQDYVNAFCKATGLSKKQESLLCKMQRLSICKNSEFINSLPIEIKENLLKSAELYRGGEDVCKLDLELYELIKRYYPDSITGDEK